MIGLRMETTEQTADSSEPENVILDIWSHSHAPPLQPPGHVTFDLRRIPNPPKHIRDSQDGRSKRLRDYLLHDAKFVNLLEAATAEILQAAKEGHGRARDETEQAGLVAGNETVTTPTRYFEKPECIDNSRSQTDVHLTRAELQREECDSDQEEPCSESGKDELKSDSSFGPVSSTSQGRLVLRISCFCERGWHRSVGFAEELGRKPWPKSWTVSVQHRDVEGQGRKGMRSNRHSGRGRRGGKSAFGFEPDHDS